MTYYFTKSRVSFFHKRRKGTKKILQPLENRALLKHLLAFKYAKIAICCLVNMN